MVLCYSLWKVYDLCSHRFSVLVAMSDTVSSCRLEFKSKQRVVLDMTRDMTLMSLMPFLHLMGMTCQTSHHWSSQISQLYYTDDLFLLK